MECYQSRAKLKRVQTISAWWWPTPTGWACLTVWIVTWTRALTFRFGVVVLTRRVWRTWSLLFIARLAKKKVTALFASLTTQLMIMKLINMTNRMKREMCQIEHLCHDVCMISPKTKTSEIASAVLKLRRQFAFVIFLLSVQELLIEHILFQSSEAN